MPLLLVHARLRLLGSDRGRTMPIRSGYRPHFGCGGTWLGAPMQTTGSVRLVDQGELKPGEEADVQIEPLAPEFWNAVRPGTLISVQEGSRVVGQAAVSDLVRDEMFTPAVASFVLRAREFRQFVEDAPRMTLNERLASARVRLLELYTAAVALPDADSEDHQERDAPPPPEGWQPFDEFESYFEVFDPYEVRDHERAPVVGLLSDDLLDVYQDVQVGLRDWDRGAWAGATWYWRLMFESHWGSHAIDALRALHRACLRATGAR